MNGETKSALFFFGSMVMLWFVGLPWVDSQVSDLAYCYEYETYCVPEEGVFSGVLFIAWVSSTILVMLLFFKKST
jgi:hypothetical protein|tara:strand:+ start:2075 stop:2299 length:225 start_codon:yes stop_codon:yes gene_type:complete